MSIQKSVRTKKINSIKNDDVKKIELGKKISMLFHDRVKGNYTEFEARTYIKKNTLQKWMSGIRNIKRESLAKFVVGLSLDVKTADELFLLQSHRLDPENNRFDCLIAASLNDNDAIDVFEEEVKKYFNNDFYNKVFKD